MSKNRWLTGILIVVVLILIVFALFLGVSKNNDVTGEAVRAGTYRDLSSSASATPATNPVVATNAAAGGAIPSTVNSPTVDVAPEIASSTTTLVGSSPVEGVESAINGIFCAQAFENGEYAIAPNGQRKYPFDFKACYDPSNKIPIEKIDLQTRTKIYAFAVQNARSSPTTNSCIVEEDDCKDTYFVKEVSCENATLTTNYFDCRQKFASNYVCQEGVCVPLGGETEEPECNSEPDPIVTFCTQYMFEKFKG